jgi:hypothetical protein
VRQQPRRLCVKDPPSWNIQFRQKKEVNPFYSKLFGAMTFSLMTGARMAIIRMLSGTTLLRMTVGSATLSWMTIDRMALVRTTLSSATLRRMTLSSATLRWMITARMTLCRTTLRNATVRRMAVSSVTLSQMTITLRRTTLSKKT